MSDVEKQLFTKSHGIDTHFNYDHDDGKLTVVNSADAQGLIDENTVMRNDGIGRGTDMRLAARIPLHVLSELQAVWKANDIDPKAGMKAFLNDPDMRAFRTSNDKV